MRIRLFGPVELIGTDGRVVALGAAKRRLVLAALALRPNRVVSRDRLIDAVWDGDPPPTARAALQGHIAQLRKVLGAGVQLSTREDGYQLVADRARIDVTWFEDLLTQSRKAQDAEAVELLGEALELHRGPVLADLPAERLRAEVGAALEEAEISAVRQLAERLHRLGRVPEAIGLLREAVERHPLREPLVELLMLGLHHDDQQAEALSLYHRTRSRLAAELGVDPGSGLRQTYQLVLGGTGDRTDARTAPAQLPRESRGFVGRDDEQDRLDALLRAENALPLLTGAAGAGKTALALRWAHRSGEKFPDGQLFADLRGFRDDDPVEPGAVLMGFLRALDVPTARVPSDVDERAALYRSVLGERRMLVVLDDAVDAEQVRPLLPGAAGCAALVTSRDRLDGLVATGGAVPVPVTELGPEQAVAALARVAGEQRVEYEPEACRELVELCERLPLAVRIAAARLAAHPRWTVRGLVDELAEPRRRLGGLSLSARGPSVASALQRTYRRLPASAAELLRLLARHPSANIDRAAATALTGWATADEQLDDLAAAHLLDETGPGRYRVPGLVRLHAETLREGDPP